jgi:ubiquinone/menaquinone biosynthesis C-methylase UbiE
MDRLWSMSTHKIYQRVAAVIGECPDHKSFTTLLDIGAGPGQLIGLLEEKFGFASSAVDYTDKLMKRPGQKVEIVDLNKQGLPYPDDHFDVVTMTEVIEHLEHNREVLR